MLRFKNNAYGEKIMRHTFRILDCPKIFPGMVICIAVNENCTW